MGLTGFNRARREAEARAIETEAADLDMKQQEQPTDRDPNADVQAGPASTDNHLDLPDTGTDAQPTAEPEPAKPAAKSTKAKK